MLLAAVAGVFFTGAALIAFFVASYFVHWVAGERADVRQLSGNRDITTAVLLVAAMWILGQHWAESRVQDLVECAKNEERFSSSSAGQIAELCAEHTPPDDRDWEG